MRSKMGVIKSKMGTIESKMGRKFEQKRKAKMSFKERKFGQGLILTLRAFSEWIMRKYTRSLM